MAGFGADQVRTGAAYEAAREQTRTRLAASSEPGRVELGAGLVLAFVTAEGIRTALEELLRAERLEGGERVIAETAAFGALVGGPDALAGILLVDVADPAALADRLAELAGIAESISLELGGSRVRGGVDAAAGGSGAFHLRFELDAAQRGALLDGATLAVAVEHPACTARVALSAEQVRAVTADLDR
jgi:hypothetical protein